MFCQHHSHSTQTYITVNNLVKVPSLRGSSNTPEVLTARGRVHLSAPPLPRPKFTRSILDTFSSSPVPVPLPKPKAPTTKRSVRLKSPTPPARFAPRSKLKLKSPPPPVKEKGFTDLDADGDTDREEDGLRAFDSTHPFFNPGSPTKNRPHASEVILVEDSDDESAEDAYDVDEEEDPTGEDIDKVLRVERWNTSKHAFALYLWRFIDPLGGPYDDVEVSFFKQDSVYDPFENDNDLIVQPKKRMVEEAYEEDIGEEDEDDYEDEEEDEQEEEEDDTDEHEDADSEDAEVEDDEEEIAEDEDSYEGETEIENNLTTQHPPPEFEYTPDLTTCAFILPTSLITWPRPRDSLFPLILLQLLRQLLFSFPLLRLRVLGLRRPLGFHHYPRGALPEQEIHLHGQVYS
jgi:hypothetical protein